MKAKLLVGVICSLFLTFPGENLWGASPKKKPQAKNQKEKSGRSSGQATASKQSKAREQAYAIAFSKVPKGARITDRGFVSGPAPKGSYTELCSLRWVLGDQQSKALEQQRKQAAEQRRKQEEAVAQRRKELQAHKNRRIHLGVADLRKDIFDSAASMGQLEKRLQSIKKNRGDLSEAIKLTIGKGQGEDFSSMRLRLERMVRELETDSRESGDLAKDLAETKAACSKWKGSTGGGKQSPSTLSKLEEEALGIKRSRSRIEFGLKKVETHYQDSTKTLFVCVAQLVRAGVSFSSEEQESIRALAQRSD